MPKAPLVEQHSIPGPVGKLESILEKPADAVVTACAVVCHPHPQHGGTMHNKVAHTLARAFVRCGFESLRFNFRGTGRSEGRYDDGNGECDDALAALRWLAGRRPGLPVWLAGFSFGAAVAIKAAVQCEPAGLVSVAPAVSRFAAGLSSQPGCPWLVIQGDDDELVDVDETVQWLDGLEPGPELLVIEGGEHFFHGRLVELRSAVTEFVDRAGAGHAVT